MVGCAVGEAIHKENVFEPLRAGGFMSRDIVDQVGR